MLQNILKYSLWVLFGITIIFVIVFYVVVVPMSDESLQMESGVTNGILGWALLLFILCAVAAIAFPIMEFVKQLAADPKGAMKTLIMVGGMLVIFIIAYALASGDRSSITETLVETNESEILWSGVGLNALYITLGISVIAVIYAEVAKKLK